MSSGDPGRKDHHTILHGPSTGSFVPSLSIQLQNVKDDRSPLCEAKGKASRAEGFRKTVRRLIEYVDCGRQRFATMCDFTSAPTISSNNDRPIKIS